MPRKPIPRLPIELPAFDHVEPDDLPLVRRGWDMAHRKPEKAAELVNLAAAGEVRHAIAKAAIGATAALLSLDRCLRCGRRIKRPESITRGVGPDCWAMGYRPPGYVDDDDVEAASS